MLLFMSNALQLDKQPTITLQMSQIIEAEKLCL